MFGRGVRGYFIQVLRCCPSPLQQKKGRGKVSSERRPVVEKELELLTLLVMKDK